MKKLVAIALSVFLLLSFAVAEDVDLSGLSFDQLVELKSRVNLAIWSCPEWQEVTVPQGMWQAGKEIPAGSWTVRCAAVAYAFVTVGNELDESGYDIKFKCLRYNHGIIDHPNYKFHEENKDLTEFSFTVEDGDYIRIENCSVIFTPYTGAPDFGFH